MVPRRKPDELRPAYHYDIRHAMTTAVVISSMCPKVVQLTSTTQKYKNKTMTKTYPIRVYVRQCQEEWDRFQKEWENAGTPGSFVPYPFSETDVQNWIEDL